jgi:hypothetical protein
MRFGDQDMFFEKMQSECMIKEMRFKQKQTITKLGQKVFKDRKTLNLQPSHGKIERRLT